jgi:hypothetical protein
MTMHRPVDTDDIVGLCEQHSLDERIPLDTAMVLVMAAKRLEAYRHRVVALAAAIERLEARNDA